MGNTFLLKLTILFGMTSYIYCAPLESNQFTINSTSTLKLKLSHQKVKNMFVDNNFITRFILFSFEGEMENGIQKENVTYVLTIKSDSTFMSDKKPGVTNCTVELRNKDSDSVQIYGILENFIRYEICDKRPEMVQYFSEKIKKIKTIDLEHINLHFTYGQNSTLPMRLLEHNEQSQDGLDTVVDMGFHVLTQKLDNFIPFGNVSAGPLLIYNGQIGRLKTIRRDGSIEIQRKDNVLTLSLGVKMIPTAFFTVQNTMPILRNFPIKFTAYAQEVKSGLTVKLDYSKNNCTTILESFVLDITDLQFHFLDVPMSGFVNYIMDMITDLFSISFILPKIKGAIQGALDDNFNCEDFKSAVLKANL